MKLDLFFVAAAMLSPASALGINCRGSGYCGQNFGGGLKDLHDLIKTIPDDRWFNNGQQIACISDFGQGSGICAFFQNTGGWDGHRAKMLTPYLVDHGCKTCGSVPTDYPWTNDVSRGQLTFNYVSRPCTSVSETKKVC